MNTSPDSSSPWLLQFGKYPHEKSVISLPSRDLFKKNGRRISFPAVNDLFFQLDLNSFLVHVYVNVYLYFF